MPLRKDTTVLGKPLTVRIAAVSACLVGLTPDARRLVVADQLGDAVSVIDLATSTVRTVTAGHNPYGVVISADGASAYVTNQGGNTVSVVDICSDAPVIRTAIGVGTHPNKLILDPRSDTLFVANGDSDEISVIQNDHVVRTFSLAPYDD
jgi:YVTN family beta-propeller protein